MAQQFRLVLKSGPDNIRKFDEDASESFKRGELVKLTGATTGCDVVAATGSISTGILGVAAKKGQNVATPTEKAEVYVVTPEQTWELHVNANKAPNANYTLGEAYKVLQITNTSFTMTREAETVSTTVNVRGPVLITTTAATASQGLVIIGWDDATKAKKGQKVLVRFAPDGCQTLKGR